MKRGRKKGFKVSAETKERLSKSHIGLTHSKETRAKLKERHKGMLGKKHSDEAKRKIGEAHKLLIYGTEESAYNWRGDKAGTMAMHEWVKRHKGKAVEYICEHCGKQASEWSNVDHSYKRKLEDYTPLCSSCHKIYDIKHNGRQKRKSFIY